MDVSHHFVARSALFVECVEVGAAYGVFIVGYIAVGDDKACVFESLEEFGHGTPVCVLFFVEYALHTLFEAVEEDAGLAHHREAPGLAAGVAHIAGGGCAGIFWNPTDEVRLLAGGCVVVAEGHGAVGVCR